MNALRAFLKMNASRAFLLVAVIISATIVLANLYKLERASTGSGVFRINTVTGAVSFCVGGTNNNCRRLSER